MRLFNSPSWFRPGMPRFLTVACLMLISLTRLYCQDKNFSNDYYISILTCGKSAELYAAFGHNAIRIKDASKNIDLCFNYGTFNFQEPEFYTKFMNGRLVYFLSITEFEDFKNDYKAEGRSVSEQVLDLNDSEKDKIYNCLVNQYNSAGRYYKYDFVKNNCSTKIVELLNEILGKDGFLLKTGENQENTIRKYVNNHLTNNPLALVGINMLFGYYADTICSGKVSLFLPDTLETVLDASLIREKNIVQEKRLILKQQAQVANRSMHFLRSSLYTILIADAILLVLFLYRKKTALSLFLLKCTAIYIFFFAWN